MWLSTEFCGKPLLTSSQLDDLPFMTAPFSHDTPLSKEFKSWAGGKADKGREFQNLPV